MIRPTLAASLISKEEINSSLKKFGSLLASEKKDGVRGVTNNGKLYSREAKLIPNIHLQKYFSDLPSKLDGEIMFCLDNEHAHPSLEDIVGIVMSKNTKWPKRWTPMFYVFDIQLIGPTYRERYKAILDTLTDQQRRPLYESIYILRQKEHISTAQIMAHFESIIDRGGEGICLRNPEGLYKSGRATVNDGCLMRYKTLTQAIGYIQGFTNLLTHVGPQASNAFGLAKRDSKAIHQIPQDEIGAIIATAPGIGEFRIGTGFTAAQRKAFWKNRRSLIGEQFLFEYRDTTAKGKPRNAAFIELILQPIKK